MKILQAGRKPVFRSLRHDELFCTDLYRVPAFDAFDDLDDFVESISCETSECQVRVRAHAGEPKAFFATAGPRFVDGDPSWPLFGNLSKEGPP